MHTQERKRRERSKNKKGENMRRFFLNNLILAFRERESEKGEWERDSKKEWVRNSEWVQENEKKRVRK